MIQQIGKLYDPKLTILIPTLPGRIFFFERLVNELYSQMSADAQFKIIVNDDEKIDIGTKRNRMMAEVDTEYMAFFDDDDMPGLNYIKHLMEGIAKGVDCCSLTGIITTDGKNPKKFIHSIEYKEMFEKDNVYYRPVMHINCLKTDLARKVAFPEWRYSEDSKWAMDMMNLGVLKTEHVIDEVIYNYLFVSDKRY
jgi:cellulose synthase/poly-beta-1,6-N-acetylglucosamine synthase-like glycosyltransferase